MAKFLTQLRWRFLPRKLPGLCQKRLLLPLSFLFFCVVYLLTRQSRAIQEATTANFNFSLTNTPYTKLVNSQCLLLEDGRWDCPDIRLQGSNDLRRSQLVAVRMLRIFDALCKKHHLRYWVTRGTLLAAVRHKGFIPWDIDLDVAMPIEDYVKFIQKVHDFPPGMSLERGKSEGKYEHIFQRKENGGQNKVDLQALSKSLRPGVNPRFRDDKSCYKYCFKFGCNWPDGIMIDIYTAVIKNNIFQDQFERISFFTKIYRVLMNSLGFDHGYSVFPLDFLKFEGFDVPIISDWKQLLVDSYGSDYMTLLPEEKRRPADDLVPDPIHSCSELEKNGKLKHGK